MGDGSVSARPRAFAAAFLLLLALGAGIVAPLPATAAANDVRAPSPAQSDWTVTAATDPRTGGPVWRVTWHPSEQIVVRGQRAVITSDGRPVGFALEAPDLRSISATTTDPTLVLGDPRFALTYGGQEVGTPAPPSLTDTPEETAGVERAPRPPVLDVDPGRRGAFEVQSAGYNLGAQALDLPALDQPVEMAGQVYWGRGAPGRRPVVLFLHGRHHTCSDGKFNAMAWPCPDGMKSVPSYRGYAGPAEVLASHGYIVISLSGNGVNAADGLLADAGALARAQLIQAHLRAWRTWAADGGAPFGSRFVGRLDFDNVGLMGHSRGGEAVVQAATRLASAKNPVGIRAVLPLAPTINQRVALPGVAMSVVLPYCDGDVFELGGQRYYEDARYAMSNDPAPRSTVLVMGANHNFFNTEWTPGTASTPAVDDWVSNWGTAHSTCNPASSTRLTAREQRAVGRAYIAGFFRLHLGRETKLLGLLDGSGRRAESAGRADVRVAAQSPSRVVLTRFTDRGAIRTNGISAGACAGAQFGIATGQPPCVAGWETPQVPHWAPTPLMPKGSTVRVMSATWAERGATLSVPVRGGRQDLRGMRTLSFRAATDPTVGTADVRVQLTDRNGKSDSVRVSDVSRALLKPPGARSPLPHTLLQQVSIPLSRFDVDRGRVTRVRFISATRRGHIWLSDLAAQRPAIGRSVLNRLPALSIDNVRIDEGNTGPRTARFTITSSRSSARDMSVYVQATRATLTDEDQSYWPFGFSGRVVIPAGRRRAVVSVPIRTNTVDDFDTTFIVSMMKSRESLVRRPFGWGLVRDDDPTPTLTISDDSATEGASHLRFKYELSAPSGIHVVVFGIPRAGTAQPGEDYADVFGVEGTLEPGKVRGNVFLEVLDDSAPEPTETMNVDVFVGGAKYSGPGALTGTIHDDD